MNLKDNFNKEDYKPLILIVDDIPKNLQVLSSVLSTRGYRISFASSGMQALSIIDSNIPDLILLDIMMPEMDGYEVCARLKKDGRTSGIPVIFLTGKAESLDIIRGLQMGAVDYITKPFNSAELLARVETHLELKRSRDIIVDYAEKLEQAEDELLRLNASKDKFFSIIAHDLRSPFSGFIGLSQLLADDNHDMSSSEIANVATVMNQAARRLMDFLENLLKWSRSQIGVLDFNPQTINLSASVNTLVKLFSDTAKQKEIELISDIDETLFVSADDGMLSTIIRNLIANAIKFTGSGGKVEVKSEKKSDAKISIKVKDTGVGIEENDLLKLFRIDARFSTTGTANEKGSGLGLILCKELIDRHGGEIIVNSKKGEGSEFIITLPEAD